MTEQHNWAGNYRFQAARTHMPHTMEELQETVASSSKVRAIGTRHSFNGIADSLGDVIALNALGDEMILDTNRNTVTVNGGLRYGDICVQLHQRGYALHNLASLPHISIAGAIATATHGSGVRNGNLATAVRGMEMVTADGNIIHLNPDADPDIFAGAVVNLGTLGIVTKVTLDIIPAFDICQNVFLNLPLEQVADHFDEIVSGAYSVSLFTNWNNNRFEQVWLKRRAGEGASVEDAATWFGAKAATENMHPIAGASATSCTDQLGVAGAWFNRLPHFKLDFQPSSGAELQSEYFVPRRYAVDAIHAIFALQEFITPHLLVSEIRTVAADNLWMSTAYGQDSVAFHFTWNQDWPSVERALGQIEKALDPYDVRPHWGKLFAMSSDTLQSRYPKFAEFKSLMGKMDPQGKFRNEFIEKYLL